MNETVILMIQIMGVIGTLVGVFAFVRLVLPIACRYSVKPRIKTKISLGREIDVESPYTKEKLFAARGAAIRICTNRNIDLSSVTLRRLCQYQKNCMLYRFLLKVGLSRDRKWCSYASVDDWDYTGSFILPTEDEKKEQARKHMMEGRLTLKPKVNRIAKDYWVALDIPLRLRDGKSHLIELTLCFGLRSEDTPFLNRLINKVLILAGKGTTYSYSEQREVYIRCEGRKEVTEKRETADRVAIDMGDRVACSYHGLENFSEYQRIMRNLFSDRQLIMKEVNPPYSKVPANEVRRWIKEKSSETEAVFTQPPDGTYHMASEDDVRIIITQMWPDVREFVLKFLDCESFTQLLRDYMKIVLLLPEILSMTYKYLVIAGENPIVSIVANTSNRSNVLAVALVHAVYSEFKFEVQMTRQKRAIRKGLDKIVHDLNVAKGKP